MSGWSLLRRTMSARSKARVLAGKTPAGRYAKRVLIAKVVSRLAR